tara:strand:- start:456 stop:644 length:189 start_codon:yes stop_codon:yes gene_type:complete
MEEDAFISLEAPHALRIMTVAKGRTVSALEASVVMQTILTQQIVVPAMMGNQCGITMLLRDI